MKTKTILFALFLGFSGSAVFAQTDTTSRKDTIPTPTDTIPKKDTLSMNSVKQNTTVFNFSDLISNNLPLMVSQNKVTIWKEELENTEA